MPTTIDSLQIEIQSNSTSASAGIKELAKSLGELKKSGTVTTAIKNLGDLSEKLRNFADASNASRSIGRVAGALKTLKGIGSVTNIGTSITKLSNSLQSLGNVDVDKVAPKIERIAGALKPLSEVKAGGINTMVNGLSKLGKVTESLDEKTIENFAERIEKLNTVLGPLSQKMTTIQAGLKGINSKARGAGSSVKQMGDEVNGASVNMASFIYSIQEAVQWLQQAIQKFSEFINESIEWDGVSARFGRGFGGEAKETYDWIQRLNDEMAINVQVFMQYSSVYATMLTGFGVAVEDATKMALGYTELTYDIWAGYNDIYKNFGDAAEAVKSAIAGEVEPIRRAGFTIVEATLEQTAANHGLNISLEKATEAQKSYLRYLTLVDQAYSQGLVGTYAKELDTAEGLMRTFSQQLKSLTQAFGSLFLPILVKVMPYVQAFVELLTDAVQALAALFGITIQGVDWSGYEDGLGGVVDGTDDLTGSVGNATEAIKELKNASLGIDELNVISPPTTSGTGSGDAGGAGNGFDGLDVDSLWDESILADINSQIDTLKEKLEGWLPIISTIGAAFGALGIGVLLAQMGESLAALAEMDGAAATLKRTLAGLAILTIEAVLVFMLSDEYLESGNLLALVGEALATAAGGYLMYKGFGDKGLVMALGVSILAQLGAIVTNLADGGVEMSDPQLWIQSAFTAATAGVAGGWLAYKGLIPMSTGKGVGLGVLAGISLTLAAITIGEVTANGELTTGSIITGIGSVVAAAGFGFTVGGPWGALIGAAVGLALNIGGIIVAEISSEKKKSLEEDLKKRFGEIELSAEMVDVYVDRITAIPRSITIDVNAWNEKTESFGVQSMTVSVSAAIDMFDVESKTLDAIGESIESIQREIDTKNIKISLGMEVSQSEYENAIDAFVSKSQEYLDQYYLTTNIAIGILGEDAGLTSTLSAFYSTNSAKLSELGSKLKQTVSEAFVDGEWIPDKLNEAIEIQKEIQEVLDYVGDIEYRATLKNLELSLQGDALTADSFKSVLDGAKKAIEERLNTLEEVKMSKLQVAIMEYDANIADGMSETAAKEIYEQTVSDIEEAYQSGRLELSYGTVDFGLSTLRDAFQEELTRAKNDGWFDVGSIIDGILFRDPTFKFDDGNGDRYGDIQLMFSDIKGVIEMEISQLKPEVKKNMESLWKELEPSLATYEEVAEANRKAGLSVPKNIRTGLNDLNELKALSGDVDGINYQIGKGLSTDPTFLNTLATAQNAGSQIDGKVAEGLLNNLDYVTDASGEVVIGIKDSVSGKTIELTPTLVSNMEQLGVDLSDGLLVGAETEMKANETSWKDWAIWPWNWFKKENEIHSPSKLFQRGGKHLTDGLVKGMGTNSLRDKLSTIWTNAKNWWNNSKGTLKTYTPSIGSISTKLSTAWSSARTWWNNKKPALGSYTPNIGSIANKVSSAWSNARTWWNKNKPSMNTYTPKIGSIRDKLVSAWNTAKNWWNKNVKLSIPSLSFKVTYTNKGLNTVQKAVVKALGMSGWPKLSFAANGGIFDQGSLVWAGERGAEVVANAAGGKTGVMNVQQMSDAVYEGVYAAVVAAMRATSGGDGSQAVNVFLDGRQITAAVEKRQRERGTSIMGTQVYSY